MVAVPAGHSDEQRRRGMAQAPEHTSWSRVPQLLPPPGVAASRQSTSGSPGVALEWWPHSTPPNPRLRRGRSMGALLQWWAWRDAAAETLPEDATPSDVMATLVVNLCQGSTEMERQSCWQHCDHWLHLSLSQWPAQVQAVTTKWQAWLPFRFRVIYVMLVNCHVLNCQFALSMLPSLMCGRHGKSGMTSV